MYWPMPEHISCVWSASSRVGDKINAWHWRRPKSRRCRVAITKAAVFPAPDGACATTSTPRTNGPMTRCWMAVGSWNPKAVMPRSRWTGRSIPSNVGNVFVSDTKVPSSPTFASYDGLFGNVCWAMKKKFLFVCYKKNK